MDLLEAFSLLATHVAEGILVTALTLTAWLVGVIGDDTMIVSVAIAGVGISCGVPVLGRMLDSVRQGVGWLLRELGLIGPSVIRVRVRPMNFRANGDTLGQG